MMKKLVGNVVSVLMEMLMWITFVGCMIGGLVMGFLQFDAIGAVVGLVVGAIAGILSNIVVVNFANCNDSGNQGLFKEMARQSRRLACA